MKLLLKIVAHCISGFGLIILFILPVNRNSWMQELEPSIPNRAIEDASNNVAVFAGLLLILTILLQSIMIVVASGRKERIGSIALIIAAVLACGLKFGI